LSSHLSSTLKHYQYADGNVEGSSAEPPPCEMGFSFRTQAESHTYASQGTGSSHQLKRLHLIHTHPRAQVQCIDGSGWADPCLMEVRTPTPKSCCACSRRSVCQPAGAYAQPICFPQISRGCNSLAWCAILSQVCSAHQRARLGLCYLGFSRPAAACEFFLHCVLT